VGEGVGRCPLWAAVSAAGAGSPASAGPAPLDRPSSRASRRRAAGAGVGVGQLPVAWGCEPRGLAGCCPTGKSRRADRDAAKART
jgi:hypothetical protein